MHLAGVLEDELVESGGQREIACGEWRDVGISSLDLGQVGRPVSSDLPDDPIGEAIGAGGS
jgi:hypothetical protein